MKTFIKALGVLVAALPLVAWADVSVQEMINQTQLHGAVSMPDLIELGRSFFGAASFQGASSADLSLKYLIQIFGPVSGLFASLAHGSYMNATVLSEGFRVLNVGLLVLLLGYAGWNTSVLVVNTAREGNILGQKVMTAKYPFRLFTAAAALAPLPSGYSVIQVFFMWAVLQGIHLANGLWNTVNFYVVQHQSLVPAAMVITSDSGDDLLKQSTKAQKVAEQKLYKNTVNLAGGLLRSQLCMRYKLTQYLGDLQARRALEGRDPSEIFARSAINPIDPEQPGVVFDTTTMTVTYPNTSCGSYDFSSLPSAFKDLKGFQKEVFLRQRFGAIQNLVITLDGMAKNWMQDFLDNSATFPQHCSPPTVDDLNPACKGLGMLSSAVGALTAEIELGARLAYQPPPPTQDQLNHSALGHGGWASAGFHYFDLTKGPKDARKALDESLQNLALLSSFETQATASLAQLQPSLGTGLLQSYLGGSYTEPNTLLARVVNDRLYTYQVTEESITGCGQYGASDSVMQIGDRCYAYNAGMLGLSPGGATQYLGQADAVQTVRRLVQQSHDETTQVGQTMLEAATEATGLSLNALQGREQAQNDRDRSFGRLLRCSGVLPFLSKSGCHVMSATSLLFGIPVGPFAYFVQMGQFSKGSLMQPQTDPNNTVNQDIQVFIYQLAKAWNTAFYVHGRENPLFQIRVFGNALFEAGMTFVSAVTMDVFYHQAAAGLSYMVQYATRLMAAQIFGQFANILGMYIAPLVEQIPFVGPVLAKIITWGIAFPLDIMKGVAQGLAGNVQLYYKLHTFATNMFVPMATGLAVPVMVIGLMLALYVPFIPLLIYAVCVLGWLLAVLECMIAAPLVALGMTHPYGHDFLGRAEQAMILIFSVMIRPAAILLGFVSGSVLLYGGFILIKMVFTQVFMATYSELHLEVMGHTLSGTILYVVLMGMVILFAYSVMAVTSQCFSLCYRLPNKLVRWIGAPPEDFGEEQALMEVQQGAQQSFSRGASAGSGMADRQVQASENFRLQ